MKIHIKPSRTIAFNAVVALFAFLTMNMEVLKEMMSPTAYGYLIMLIAAGNAMLRAVTTEPLITTEGDAE